MGEIFLSYSRHDQEFADSLTRSLGEQGLRVWVDRQDIQAGDSWRAAISHAIAECDAFLVVLSPQCVASKYVVKELTIAESRDRHIIPIMYRRCEIPQEMEMQLSGLQWVDFSETTFENALERLVGTLRAGRGQVAPVSAKPAVPGGPPAAPPGPVPMPAPSLPFAQAPQTVNAYQELARLLCGRWNVQIGMAYVGAVGQITLELSPNGAFGGQIMSPAGISVVNGVWQVTPAGQLALNGQQTVGWLASPYVAVIQFTQVSPAALVGTSGGGEQLFWSRIG